MRLTSGVLNDFTGVLHASAEVEALAEQVYAVVRDPAFVAGSTPFIRRVVVLADDLWRWEMGGILYPGGTFTGVLTQRMAFDPPHTVTFHHDEASRGELAGAAGAFRITEVARDRVRLDLEVQVTARIPAPRAAAAVVEGAMHVVLGVMRDRFVRSLEREMAVR